MRTSVLWMLGGGMAPWSVPDHLRKPRSSGDPKRPADASDVPVWVAAILLFIAYGITIGPLKMARRICYWGAGEARGTSLVVFLDMIIWVAVVLCLILLAACYLPEVHHAIESIPQQAHQAADTISAWWTKK